MNKLSSAFVGLLLTAWAAVADTPPAYFVDEAKLDRRQARGAATATAFPGSFRFVDAANGVEQRQVVGKRDDYFG